jgi:hypothetical protein
MEITAPVPSLYTNINKSTELWIAAVAGSNTSEQESQVDSHKTHQDPYVMRDPSGPLYRFAWLESKILTLTSTRKHEDMFTQPSFLSSPNRDMTDITLKWPGHVVKHNTDIS